MVIDGDVPQGAGLSSSAALEVVVATALNELYGLGLTKMEIALAAQKAENDFVGMPCGIMDQAASSLGEEGRRCSWTAGASGPGTSRSTWRVTACSC